MAGLTQHLIQRGNNRSEIFRSRDDYEFFLAALGFACHQQQVELHAYALMTTHVHLLVTPRMNSAISRAMQSLGRIYVLYFNRRYARTGGLFEGRYRSFIIDNDSYWFTCMRYVELNPVRAGLVSQPEDYRWSSYRRHANGTPNEILTPHPLYLALGDSPARRQEHWREMCREVLGDQQLTELRRAAHKGGALGRVVMDEG